MTLGTEDTEMNMTREEVSSRIPRWAERRVKYYIATKATKTL